MNTADENGLCVFKFTQRQIDATHNPINVYCILI
jgi:hypothetical protein